MSMPESIVCPLWSLASEDPIDVECRHYRRCSVCWGDGLDRLDYEGGDVVKPIMGVRSRRPVWNAGGLRHPQATAIGTCRPTSDGASLPQALGAGGHHVGGRDQHRQHRIVAATSQPVAPRGAPASLLDGEAVMPGPGLQVPHGDRLPNVQRYEHHVGHLNSPLQGGCLVVKTVRGHFEPRSCRHMVRAVGVPRQPISCSVRQFAPRDQRSSPGHRRGFG